MEKEFFEMYERQSGLSLECGHNSVSDWVLIVRDKRKVRVGQKESEVCQVQDCDRGKVFAEAYCRLAEYLSDTRGGY